MPAHNRRRRSMAARLDPAAESAQTAYEDGRSGEGLAFADRRVDHVEAGELTLERSAARTARGNTVRLNQSVAAVALARDAHLHQSASVAAIAAKVVAD